MKTRNELEYQASDNVLALWAKDVVDPDSPFHEVIHRDLAFLNGETWTGNMVWC